ncbi:MAG: hypothetical protein KatS3mg105_2433 [Gemmatales bacterium]|nr:MAG: hypothetical protein KatS3mg105_2433 [Gemmatales bacterium]
MYRAFRSVGFLVLLWAVFPAPGADDNKTTESKKEKLVPFGQPLIAKVVAVEGESLKFVYKQPKLDPKKRQFVAVDQEATLQIWEHARIRKEWIKKVLGEDGKPRLPNEEEKRKAKGDDPKAWGYAADIANLEPGRVVRLFLAKRLGAPRAEPPLIREIHIARVPGDEEIGGPSGLLGGLPTIDPDAEVVPYGPPQVGMLVKSEKGKMTLRTQYRAFNGKGFEVKTRDIDLILAPQAKIRIEWPPPALDENDQIKKYTEEELKALKGEEGLWGYPGDRSYLQAGRIVQVQLVKAKDAARSDPPFVNLVYIKKEPGDDQIDPQALRFFRPVPGTLPPDENAKKKDDGLVPYGQPFIATLSRTDRGLTFTRKQRVLNGDKVGYRDVTVTYQPAPGMKIRVEETPIIFDTKGRPKKFTPEELKKLQGPERLWGFTGKKEHLIPGRTVMVFLGKKRDAAVDDPPVVRMIYIAKPPMDAVPKF